MSLANPDTANTILFVCTGNTCRSPMAEALMREALAEAGPPLSDLKVESAGVGAYPGAMASGHSINVMEQLGHDLTTHRSQQVTSPLLDTCAAVFCMTNGHRAIIQNRFPQMGYHGSAFLMREFMENPRTQEIEDPAGLDLNAYTKSRNAIAEAIPSIIEFLKNRL